MTYYDVASISTSTTDVVLERRASILFSELLRTKILALTTFRSWEDDDTAWFSYGKFDFLIGISRRSSLVPYFIGGKQPLLTYKDEIDVFPPKQTLLALYSRNIHGNPMLVGELLIAGRLPPYAESSNSPHPFELAYSLPFHICVLLSLNKAQVTSIYKKDSIELDEAYCTARLSGLKSEVNSVLNIRNRKGVIKMTEVERHTDNDELRVGIELGSFKISFSEILKFREGATIHLSLSKKIDSFLQLDGNQFAKVRISSKEKKLKIEILEMFPTIDH